MPRRKTFKCGRCKRTSKMGMHLARHMSAMHGVKKAGKKAGKRKFTKRVKRSYVKVGWPTGIVARLGLRDMGLEQLSVVIDAARLEARLKLAQAEAAFR